MEKKVVIIFGQNVFNKNIPKELKKVMHHQLVHPYR